MKCRIYFCAALIFSLLICFTSCESVPTTEKAKMLVMVYDFNNREVKDVSIQYDDTVLGCTDIYGRFMIPISDSEIHHIVLSKEHYESLNLDIELKDNEVLYVKIGSSLYYANEAEIALDRGDYNAAEKYIDKALSIEDRKDYQFLKSVILGNKNE